MNLDTNKAYNDLKEFFYRYFPHVSDDDHIKKLMLDKDHRINVFSRVSERGVFDKNFMFVYMQEIDFGKFLVWGHNNYNIISNLDDTEFEILFNHLLKLSDNETLTRERMIWRSMQMYEDISCKWIDKKMDIIDELGLKLDTIKLVSDNRLEGWFLEKYRDFYDATDIAILLDEWHPAFDTKTFAEDLKWLVIKHLNIYDSEVENDEN